MQLELRPFQADERERLDALLDAAADAVEEWARHGTSKAANRFNMRIQKLDGPLAMRGAMKGSHPIGEDYMQWKFPNWATKFFMDALMFERLFDRIDNIG